VTFFVDANVVVYSAVPSEYRDGCLQVLEAIARGEVGGRTSTAALEEVWYIERSGRAGKLDGLTEHAYTLFTPLLLVTDESFRLALALAVEAPQLGTNDRLHVGTCLAHEVGVIVSADAGFDGVRGIRRVDPLDARSRRRLLASGR
jgi:predicted nucleic acid-binding protein